MVLCWIALPVFAFLGIFSAKYRKLTKDAFECFYKTTTFRKCESGLDDKIRSDISGTFLKFSPKTAKFVYKNYKLLSWVFVIVLIWSSYVGAVGLYNYLNYGNCNGPTSNKFCLLDPTGKNTGFSELEGDIITEITFPSLEENDPIIGPENAELTIIEFGCYTCPYTKQADETVQEVIDYYDGKVNFQFRNFPIPRHELSFETALAANCALEQEKYKPYHDLLFEKGEILTKDLLYEIAEEVGLNTQQFSVCLEQEKYKNEVEADFESGKSAGVSGTPTFFINEQKIVGPKPFKTFKNIIEKEIQI